VGRESGAIEAVRKAFPGREALVERSFERSPAFRSLCRDYRDCLRALEHWSGQASAEREARRREYTELLLELDREIRTWLEAVRTGLTGSDSGDPRPGADPTRREDGG